MSDELNLPTVYEPQTVEPAVRQRWSDGNYFHAEPADPRETYTIVIPPPNVTGALHGGHALNNTLQDILIRWRRMQGYNTLWMPGTDHAGIATQAVVERRIYETEKKTRRELGREELVRRIWEWKEQYGNRIIEQLQLMGCSCDWERTRFTLDEVCARAVRHTFFKLFKDGLIVRGKRLVNWDTHLQTAVADDEVYHETVKGKFYHFRYSVIDPQPGEPAFVHIATTRPETMLGDTAVAVHPEPDVALDKLEAQLRTQIWEAAEKDRPPLEAALQAIAERRVNLLPTLLKLRDLARAGRYVLLPLVNRPIPLICDEWADPMLGSGCVKITPAHDPNDYEVGQRHKLPMINVMTPDGRVADLSSHTCKPDVTKTLEGLKFATDGRKAVVAELDSRGLVELIEDREIDLGHSDRSKTPIEPYLSDQWFVRMGDVENASQIEGLRGSSGLAQLAMDHVCEKEHANEDERKACGKVHFFPARYAKTYLDWLGEKRDWCISRQLWWGHRIPVWRAGFSQRKIDGSLQGKAILDRQEQLRDELAQALQELGVASGCKDDFFVTAQDRTTASCLICVRTEKARDQLERVRASLAGDQIPSLDPIYQAYLKIQDLLVLPENLTEDSDVLDTWFSSALWPHSTLGWPAPQPDPLLPESGKLLARYYPGSVLSTAREIITLWVARMVITGLYNLGKVPFHDVYIHAVIQDEKGRPFKKTLGNGFDPVDIIEFYGADALRFTMASSATETQDIRMPMKKVKTPDGRELQTSERFELGRNFCNKLWNAARFAFMTLGEPSAISSQLSASQSTSAPGSLDLSTLPSGTGVSPVQSTGQRPVPHPTAETAVPHLDLATLPIEDRWILSRTSAAAVEVQAALADFQFSKAAGVARDFFWDSVCDWYLELVKLRVRENRQAAEARAVLAFVLDQSLRLLHPFVPFITERLWQQLNEILPERGLPGILSASKPQGGRLGAGSTERILPSPVPDPPSRGESALAVTDALIVAPYPPQEGWRKLVDGSAEDVFADLQRATRAVREVRQTQNVPPRQRVGITIKVPPERVEAMQREAHVIQHLANVGQVTIDPEALPPAKSATLVVGDMQMFVHDVIDPAAERQRLEKDLTGLDRQIAGLRGKLDNPGFLKNAPRTVVASEQQRLADLNARREQLLATLSTLG